MGSGAIKGGLYALMFLNLGVLLFLFKRQHTLHKKLTALVGVLLSVLALGSGVVIIKLDSWVAQKKHRVFQARERKYQHIGYKRFGEEVAKRHPKAKILIIRHQQLGMPGEDVPDHILSPVMDLQLAAFKEGLGPACEIVAIEEVRIEMDLFMMEKPKLGDPKPCPIYSAKVFDALLKKNSQATVVVSLAGLPIDMEKMKIWDEDDPTKRPALILVDVATHNLKKAMKRGFISAILLSNFQSSSLDTPVPDDEDAAFANRFLFVTPENMETIKKKYPKRF